MASLLHYYANVLLTRDWKLRAFVDGSAGIAVLAGQRGITFEGSTLRLLELGGKFETRKLGCSWAPNSKKDVSVRKSDAARDDAGDTSEWEFVACMRRVWDTLDDLQAACAEKVYRLLVPKSSNCPGPDAFVMPHGMQQYIPVDCTVAGGGHRIDVAALAAAAVRRAGYDDEEGWPLVAGRSNRDLQIKWMWLLPEDVYDNYVAPQGPKGAAADASDAAAVTDLELFRRVVQ